MGESHAVRNRREYFWTGREKGRGERGRDAFVARERERERGLMSCFFFDLVIFGIDCVDTSLDERVEHGSRWIF